MQLQTLTALSLLLPAAAGPGDDARCGVLYDCLDIGMRVRVSSSVGVLYGACTGGGAA